MSTIRSAPRRGASPSHPYFAAGAQFFEQPASIGSRGRGRSDLGKHLPKPPIRFTRLIPKLAESGQVALKTLRSHLISTCHEGIRLIFREGVQVGAQFGERLLEVFAYAGRR